MIATTLKSLQQRKVLLAVGKVDQYSPTLPYGVLSSAFRTLTLHLLGLPAGEVATWKIRLSRALEGYEELAVSLVPELNLLLENKPRFSADTFSIDARARFSHMVLALVKTFATGARRWCCWMMCSGSTLPACKRSITCCARAAPSRCWWWWRTAISVRFLIPPCRPRWRACRRRRSMPRRSCRSRCR